MKLNQVNNGDIITKDGIFQTLFKIGGIDFLTSEDTAKTIDIDYYYNNSGEKTISPMFSKLLEVDPVYYTTLAKVIKIRFGDKWNKIYNTLMVEYSVLNNYSTTETKTIDGFRTETPNIEHTMNESIDTSLTTSNSVDNGMYAFNSEGTVPTTVGEQTTLVNGTGDNNKTSRVESESGTRDFKSNNKEVSTKNGYIGTPQDNLLKELKLREYNMFDIIYVDVDSVLTIPLYE